MNHNVEQYRQIQALADRRTVGQRRADVEAWRKPPAHNRRRIDVQPVEESSLGMMLLTGLAGLGLWALFGWGVATLLVRVLS
jgi:hypothetical protein